VKTIMQNLDVDRRAAAAAEATSRQLAFEVGFQQL